MGDIDWVGMAEKVGIAIVIVIVTWVVAQLVKWAIGKLVGRMSFLRRQGADGQSTGQSLGQIGSLFVWLFGLVAVLQVFALNAALSPIQGLLSTVMRYLPNVIGAAVVFFIGFVIAKIVKQLIESAVGMVNFGSIAAKMKKAEPANGSSSSAAGYPSAGMYQAEQTESVPGMQPYAGAEQQGQQPQGTGVDARRIGSMVGNLAFAVILILVSIAALQILDISVISDPAKSMLAMILNTIPMIIAAALILAIGYFISKLVGNLLESTLRGLGTDGAVVNLGIMGADKSASTILTRIAQVAIMVFFAVMATRALDFPEVTKILDTVLSLGGRVLFGGVIIAVGFLVAKIIVNAIGDGTATTVVRYATITLFAAMGLKYMGIANSIITVAFGSVVVGGALAAALAFGLGGRDAAARYLAQRESQRDITPS